MCFEKLDFKVSSSFPVFFASPLVAQGKLMAPHCGREVVSYLRSFSTGSPLEMSFSWLVCGCHSATITCGKPLETQLGIHLANNFGGSTSEHLMRDSLTPHGGFLLADTFRYSLRLPQHPMTTSGSLPWHLETMGNKGWPMSGSLTLSTPSCHHFCSDLGLCIGTGPLKWPWNFSMGLRSRGTSSGIGPNHSCCLTNFTLSG